MNLVIPAACLALLAAFVAVLVYPVLAAPRAWRRPMGGDRRRLELTERKEQIYASIKELELDHGVGKMSRDDHDSLRAELESEALGVLSRLQQLEAGDPDRDLRRRIEEEARTLAAAPPDPAPDPCPGCGRNREPAHRFCPGCGRRLDDPSPAP